MSLFASYIPIDRRLALSGGNELPDRANGTVLFADLSGFTQLTSRLTEALGRKRGAEELLPLLNRIYSNIVRAIHDYGGSVIHFSGDAATCWFDADGGEQAVTAAVVMQHEIAAFESVTVPGGFTASISMKVSISCGNVRRFLVGSPQHMRSDVLAGRLVDEVAQGERLARKGEILLSEGVVSSLGASVSVEEWRVARDGMKFGVLKDYGPMAGRQPWPEFSGLREAVAAQFVLPNVAERLRKGEGHYLAEIRPVTAVFMQFSGLDYDHDDLAGEKLDRYVRWVQQVVEQYDGVLLQLTIGDKGAYFFLGFGAPVAHSDDVLRAVAAALLLRNVPAELGFIRNIKIGIAQGQMRTGAYGGETRLSYGVLGEKVNRAARLMSYAPVGEIYCDDSVYVSVHDRWETELVPAEVDRDGKRETVPLGSVYRLTGDRMPRGRQFGLSRRLVGREEELRRLQDVLDKTISGAPGIAWISGEAGIGKSHLVREFSERAEMDGFFVIGGAGSSIEQQTAYWAWRSVLSGFFGWDAGPPSRERLRLVEALVSTMAPGHIARLPVLNDIAYLGIPENDLTAALPTALRLDNVVLLIAELLRVRSVTQPVLLILEDVHWMDDLSWLLSIGVFRRLQELNERVAVVWTTRPLTGEEMAGRESDARSLAGLTEIVVERMPTDQILHLVAMELGISPAKVPAELDAFVQEKSEGNPFFARELVLTLKDRRLIWYLGAAAEQPWQLAEDFHMAASALPDTLQGLILARIDQLTLDQQTTLKAAAVIGRAFKENTLAHVVKSFAFSALEALPQHISALTGAGLIQENGERAYVFNHILTRDTTYQTLLFAQRRLLHEVVAGWYENAYPGDSLAPFYPTLAYHYQNAELPDREFGYVCKSADQAQKRYANREALDYLARGLALSESPEERFRLRMQREEIYGLVGDRSAQARELAELEKLCQANDRGSWDAELFMRFAQFHLLNGSYQDAMENAGSVIGIGERSGDRKILARGAHIRGKVHLQKGEYADAGGDFDRALEAYLAEEADGPIAEVYGDYGILEVYKGDFQRAVPLFEKAIELHRAINNRREIARNQSNLAGAYGFLRDIEKAIENYKEAYEINREIGERRIAHIAHGNLGAAYLDCGEYNLALQHLNEALVTSRVIGDVRKEGTWLGILGEVSLAIGRYHEAVNYIQEALRISTDIGNKNGQGQWLNRLGDAYRLQGQPAQARSWLTRGLAVNEEIGNQGEVASARQSLGMVFLEENRWAQAAEAFDEAVQIRTELGQQVHRTNLLPGVAFVALKQNQASEATRRLEEFWGIWTSYSDQQRSEADLWSLFTAGQVFEHLGDQRAVELGETAYRLMNERAGRISDPETRREFLESVPTNRMISLKHGRRQAIV